MIVRPANLLDGTVLEGDDYKAPDVNGAMADATVPQIKAYKSDMEGQSYLIVCLKNYTDLLCEAQMAGK